MRDPIVVRLGNYYTKEEADRWLNSPHPQLGGQTAAHLIAIGQDNDVHAVLDRLEADGYL